ncbi:hypothetical protein M0802_008124 [Mischocyttarus mexicanus]|nr:hypothetical protein M0802_008124 [Mischocyttarus mexicanus]
MSYTRGRNTMAINLHTCYLMIRPQTLLPFDIIIASGGKLPLALPTERKRTPTTPSPPPTTTLISFVLMRHQYTRPHVTNANERFARSDNNAVANEALLAGSSSHCCPFLGAL